MTVHAPFSPLPAGGCTGAVSRRASLLWKTDSCSFAAADSPYASTPTHGQHGLIQHFVLQKAAFHRQHLVAVCRVDAGGQFSTPAGGKGGDHLVAVMIRVLHAPDGVHRAVFALYIMPHLYIWGQIQKTGMTYIRF